MLGRDVELVLPDRALASVLQRAERWDGGRRYSGLWIRVRDGEVTTRYLTGGRLMEDGVLRGRFVQRDRDVVLVGRMRWFHLTWITCFYLVVGLGIAAMAIGYRNDVIGWIALAPWALAALWFRRLLHARYDDPERLLERLRKAL